MRKTHEVPMSHCPFCLEPADRASAVDHEFSPKPGDVSVCLKCQGVVMFGEHMELLPAPAEVVAEVTLELSRAQKAIKRARS